MRRKTLLHAATICITLGLLAAAGWALNHMLHEHTWAQVLASIRAIPAWRVGLSVALMVAGYTTLTLYDEMAVRYVGGRLAYPKVAMASFIAYAFSHSIGLAAVTGTGIRYRLYTHWGIKASDIVRITAFVSITFFVGLMAVGAADFLIAPVPLPSFMKHLPINTTRPLGYFLLVALAAYLAWTFFWRRTFNVRGFKLVPPTPAMSVLQVGVSSLDWLLAAAVFWVLLPRGPGAGVVLGVFVLSVMAGFISHVPGGLGIFEAVALFLFQPYLPKDQVLGALIVYRLIYYLLPLVGSLVVFSIYEASTLKALPGRALAWLRGRTAHRKTEQAGV